jgi:hypothetical protein
MTEYARRKAGIPHKMGACGGSGSQRSPSRGGQDLRLGESACIFPVLSGPSGRLAATQILALRRSAQWGGVKSLGEPEPDSQRLATKLDCSCARRTCIMWRFLDRAGRAVGTGCLYSSCFYRSLTCRESGTKTLLRTIVKSLEGSAASALSNCILAPGSALGRECLQVVASGKAGIPRKWAPPATPLALRCDPVFWGTVPVFFLFFQVRDRRSRMT